MGTITTVEDLTAALRDNKLLEPEQLRELTTELADRFFDPRTMAKYLLQKGWLTVYQVNTLLQGEGQQLSVGPYRILDCLGTGAVSHVFKAWDPRHRCLAVVKAIKAEHWSNTEAVGRFKREMRVVAQMSHPNLVRAFDVDLDNPRHWFAMEYIEGTDLDKLVKLGGAVPVPKACDYIRQAANGLQYVHERGLIHRDIKPGNLFLTQDQPVVKILDLGMTRLRLAGHDQESLSRLTMEGMMIGTPDFLAPEQARNPHNVDIRADLYGLGCTLFYLLAGRPPFMGTTALQKLYLHQTAAPDMTVLPAVPGITDVIRQTMAKNPIQRYRTPAELAKALQPLCPTGTY